MLIESLQKFDTLDWLSSNISAIRRWFTPSSNKDIASCFCSDDICLRFPAIVSADEFSQT